MKKRTTDKTLIELPADGLTFKPIIPQRLQNKLSWGNASHSASTSFFNSTFRLEMF